MAGANADRQAVLLLQQPRPPVRLDQQRRQMPGCDDLQFLGLRVKFEDRERRPAVAAHRDEQFVEHRDDVRELVSLRHVGAQSGADLRHHGGGQHAAPDDVPDHEGDAAVDELEARIANAGLRLALFDLTNDTGTPTVMALVGPARAGRYFDIAAGFGTHPIAARAAVKAITEAAQSRVTAIAGSRDDIAVSEYDDRPDEAVARLFAVAAGGRPPKGLAGTSTVEDGLASMAESLAAAGVTPDKLDRLADLAFQDACHQSNPRPCSRDDLRALYAASM